ncbi:MAG TPA: cysteine--1-D-myo-inosityl 2-amino-2-deoxy-alpha-D-glucopyranoside ligase [Mycobacteriales bacterium]|nr:cysteine--1-D-myo-inosityl 2-amino-2-deoxy-alpha-D-glucopyranoside ligase [Mycobacteriales bacterium]
MESWESPRIPQLPGTGVPLRVYDTAAGQVRPLAPGADATMYVCGITPYDATHLGHAATYLTFDLLGRVLRDGGHRVRYVQNVTDVDDPLLERAAATGEDWRDLARRETDLFRRDMAALRVIPPEHYVGAVESIPLVVQMITRLLDAGAAYTLEGDVYFAVSSSSRLGQVSHADRATMLTLSAERGGDPERAGKKDPLDALMWRAERAGEPSWESPFGPGRPGWHVECAAIAVHHLGPTIDVQGGGVDLAFPHHELSAAHAEVCTGNWPFARAYVHQAMVALDGHKMSKSRGNLELVSRLRAAGHDPMAIRAAMLAHRHGADWEWTPEQLTVAAERVTSWRRAVDAATGPSAEPLLREVRAALADDLDSPRALRAVDRWVDETARHRGRDTGAPRLVRDLVDALLGIRL